MCGCNKNKNVTPPVKVKTGTTAQPVNPVVKPVYTKKLA